MYWKTTLRQAAQFVLIRVSSYFFLHLIELISRQWGLGQNTSDLGVSSQGLEFILIRIYQKSLYFVFRPWAGNIEDPSETWKISRKQVRDNNRKWEVEQSCRHNSQAKKVWWKQKTHICYIKLTFESCATRARHTTYRENMTVTVIFSMFVLPAYNNTRCM